MTIRIKLRGLGRYLHPATSNALLYIEVALLILGLVFIGVVTAATVERALHSHLATQSFNRTQESASAQTYERRQQDVIAVKDLRDDRGSNLDSAFDAQGAALAMVHIPRLNLSAPVLEGTDWLTLNHGVGHIAGTARPGERGNIGIAGHRDTFFRRLKDVHVGDAIELERGPRTDNYTVDRIQIVTPDNVGVLRPRAVPSLTLVTCYPFYFVGSAPKRFIVTASLATEPQHGKAKPDDEPTIPSTQPNKEKQ